MKLTITSTEKDVTFTRSQDVVLAKNTVFFELYPKVILFRLPRERFEIRYEDVKVNGEQVSRQTAKPLLSAALFREASGGDGSDTGGDMNNWNQTDW